MANNATDARERRRLRHSQETLIVQFKLGEYM